MIAFMQDNLTAIVTAILALIAGGLVVRFLRVRSGRDTNIVNQKGANSTGDITGRDKISNDKKAR